MAMELISHCIKRDPNKLEGRATLGMLIMLVVLSLLGWIYLTQASHVATASRRIEELQVDKARLEQQNLELMVEVAELESTGRLFARAKELGFTTVALDDTEFVVAAVPDVPQVPIARSRDDGGSGDNRTRSTGWLDHVASQFTAWVQSESP
jgi:cell division protein FtsL